jgi:dihydrofolate reductase
MQKISLIAAMSENRVIGHKKKLPWNMPADWQHFRKITHDKAFIMGKNSYEAPDKLLSTKKSIILSHTGIHNLCGNCFQADSWDSALEMLSGEPEIFILGGQSVFEQAISFAHYIYLTIIHAELSGDAYFPQIKLSQWKIIRDEFHHKDSENPYDYSFLEYERF